MAVRGVLIDLDGTLIDTLPDFHASVNAMRAELKLAPVEMEQVRNWIGQGTERLVVEALGDVASKTERERLYPTALASYLSHYARFNGTFSSLYPGVDGALRELSAMKLGLACVTNKPHDFAVGVLRQFELLGYFKHVQGGTPQAPKKPDPYPILKACLALEIDPNQAIVVGDSSNDVTAAHAAGCTVLLLPYGYNHGQSVKEAGADAIVDTLSAAVDWIAHAMAPA